MEILKKISEKTGIETKKLTNYGLGLAVACVMFGIGSSYITNVIGVAYPAFMSFLALESEGLEDDKQWLTYWVCFGAFNVLDQFAGFILRFIPFYYFLKLGFLVFLFHPSFTGATYVYNNYISEFVKENQQKIDDLIKKGGEMANEAKH